MADLLSAADITAALSSDLSSWTEEGGELVRSIQAPSFPEGIELVRRVADVAERMNHHPDIDIRWTTVTFRLSTHSAGGLTASDLDLAREIDSLAPPA